LTCHCVMAAAFEEAVSSRGLHPLSEALRGATVSGRGSANGSNSHGNNSGASTAADRRR
jgi:hypothetical protein